MDMTWQLNNNKISKARLLLSQIPGSDLGQGSCGPLLSWQSLAVSTCQGALCCWDIIPTTSDTRLQAQTLFSPCHPPGSCRGPLSGWLRDPCWPSSPEPGNPTPLGFAPSATHWKPRRGPRWTDSQALGCWGAGSLGSPSAHGVTLNWHRWQEVRPARRGLEEGDPRLMGGPCHVQDET